MYFAYYNLFVDAESVKDLMVVFLIGFSFDSTFNKYEATTEVSLKK